jgi:DNA-binding transcriptional regulator YiaG
MSKMTSDDEKPLREGDRRTTVKASKRKRLREAGFRIGSAADFLGLNDEEQALVAMKLELVDGVKALRSEQGITQAELARRLGSSQSRVAKLEAGDRSVSIDLLMRALLNLGASRKQIGAMIGNAQRRKPAA